MPALRTEPRPGAPGGQPPCPYYLEAAPVEEVNLIQYVNILLKRRWLIVGGCFLCVLLAGIVSKKTPPTFTAVAKFLPSNRPEMTARMGTIIGESGKLESFDENLTSEYYVALMQSNLFLERIARRKFPVRKLGREADLVEYYTEAGKKKGGAGSAAEILQRVIEKKIRGSLDISAGRRIAGPALPVIVTVKYSAREPGLAAAVANAFLEETIVYNQDVRDSKAQQNREFIEKQIEESTGLLGKAENELAQFTAGNKKIATPDLEVELDRLKRSVRIQEEVYISLKKQLELAKIEEQERKPSIEVIEGAVPPLQKSAPRTLRTVILAGFLSLFLFCGLAFLMEWLGKARRNRNDEKYREFIGHLEDIKKDIRGFRRLFRK
jgi:uncharacterized protein involved in exopolysaccharide biosynthesis